MYSQHEEEKAILDYFGDKVGRFYDIGAWTGLKFSNTRALLERGWSGVMVEPSPTAFVGLMQNTAEFGDRVRLVNAAITKALGLMVFYDAGGDAVGTLDVAHRDKWQPHLAPMRSMYTNTLPADMLFATFGQAEFINLDVEGINLELFKLLPLAWPDLRCVCVEYDAAEAEIVALAAASGYKPAYKSAENLVLVK